MSYVESNLMSGETVVYRAKLHWFVFVGPIALEVIALSLFTFGAVATSDAAPVGFFIGAICLVLGFATALSAAITFITTELAVTNKRVIAKFGLIRRHTIELNHTKVESYNVDQGIIGRILGFGTIVINGTGGGKNPIRQVRDPLEFRKQAMTSFDDVTATRQAS